MDKGMGRAGCVQNLLKRWGRGRGVKKGAGGRETNVPAPAAVVVIVVATSLPWHQHSTIAVKAGEGHWLCNAKVSTLFNQSILDLNAHKFGIIKTTVDN